jgi:hypothetical protein
MRLKTRRIHIDRSSYERCPTYFDGVSIKLSLNGHEWLQIVKSGRALKAFKVRVHQMREAVDALVAVHQRLLRLG